MPWHGQPMPWPWHALAAHALAWAAHALAVASLGSHGIALAARALAWAAHALAVASLGSHGIALAWAAHALAVACLGSHGIALAAHALALALPWQGLPTKNNLFSRKEASWHALGSLGSPRQLAACHAARRVHAACPKRAFSPSRKIGPCHFRF
jgi:hypothetical protein